MNMNISETNPERLISLKNKVLDGGTVSREEALELAAWPDIDALCDAAEEIMNRFVGRKVDSCSIVNARSGRCSEDCKWCAQSVKYSTGCEEYPQLPDDEVLGAARHNEQAGIHRFSLVTSGRRVSDADIDSFCRVFRRLSSETSLYLCASMGLITDDAMRKLKEAGVKRYHCNMETSSKYFPKLCGTHTPADKRKVIESARRHGMKVCSGGIIGMGESMSDRIDLALELRELDVDSVPINILNPIPGTPLQDTPLISEEDVIRTVAVFRFILPTKALRFAGGRLRMSEASLKRIFHGGMNGVLMGDMLTTVSNQIADDKRLFAECGMEF